MWRSRSDVQYRECIRRRALLNAMVMEMPRLFKTGRRFSWKAFAVIVDSVQPCSARSCFKRAAFAESSTMPLSTSKLLVNAANEQNINSWKKRKNRCGQLNCLKRALYATWAAHTHHTRTKMARNDARLYARGASIRKASAQPMHDTLTRASMIGVPFL